MAALRKVRGRNSVLVAVACLAVLIFLPWESILYFVFCFTRLL